MGHGPVEHFYGKWGIVMADYNIVNCVRTVWLCDGILEHCDGTEVHCDCAGTKMIRTRSIMIE